MLRLFHRSRDGSTAVEFAVIAPVFLAMIMGLIEFGMIFFTLTTAQNASWEVARQVATGRMQVSAAAQAVRDRLPSWAQASAEIASPTLTNGVYRVSVRIPMLNATATNFFASVYGTNSINTSASFQQESN